MKLGFVSIEKTLWGDSKTNDRIFGGKATKRSRYGAITKDRIVRTLRSAEICRKGGLKYHVIDSEWKWTYLTSYEAHKLISYSEGLVTVITFSTRHYGSLRLMQRIVRQIAAVNDLALNLVIGNKAYLNSSESRRPAIRTLIDSIKFVRRHFGNITVFIGTEGLTEEAARLAAEYDLTPFVLLDKYLQRDLSLIKDVCGNRDVAVYIPFLVSSNYARLLRDVLYRLSGYMLRRRWVQNELRRIGYNPSMSMMRSIIQEKKPLPNELLRSKLGSLLKLASESLALYGDEQLVVERLRNLRRLGVSTFIGLPIKENDQQILWFARCLDSIG